MSKRVAEDTKVIFNLIIDEKRNMSWQNIDTHYSQNTKIPEEQSNS